MSKPRARGHHKARELREFRRINKSSRQVAEYLRAESEKTAECVCRELQKLGLIEQFWHIPPFSTLNLLGVDFVCQTAAGYFFLNVERSFSGMRFLQRRAKILRETNKQLPLIYPWKITLENGRAKEELCRILSYSPSFCKNSLPEDIKKN